MTKFFFPLLFISTSLVGLLGAEPPAAIHPSDVAIVYNAQDKNSQALAFKYAKARDVPSGNLIALDLPDKNTITREEFNTLIRDPLTETFTREVWWSRREDDNGVMIPVRNKIRVLLLVKGVPYRIKRQPEEGPDGNPQKPAKGRQNEASVDSELVYLGLSKHEIAGPLTNPYFEKSLGINDPSLTPLIFPCRLDGASYQTCERIIEDSLEVEKTSLWGFCYLDEAMKGKNFEMGDEWLRSIARLNRKEGIPTIVERTRDVFTTNYPMQEAALYYGWYSQNANGPLLNKRFRFKKGAVAMHLHSFSAVDLQSKSKNWVGPILEKGAAATIGNVWEPYLAGTHHFDILHQRLLAGYSLVEAAHMAIPAHSWQSVVVGDPLYRPFKNRANKPEVAESDKAFLAYHLAIAQWGSQPDTLVTKIRTAAARMSSGILYEALGLRRLAENNIEEAKAFFESAGRSYPGAANKLRQELHLIAIHRRFNEKEAALELITAAQKRFGDIPETKSLVALKNILDPPAPPPAESKVAPQ
jgi:uncharacterized protein (TIGR03790 family)